MPHTVDDIARLVITDNAADLPAAVNDVLLQKIGDRLEARRQEVATAIFNKTEAPVEA
jgi:hypothetical protein